LVMEFELLYISDSLVGCWCCIFNWPILWSCCMVGLVISHCNVKLVEIMQLLPKADT